MRLFNSVKFCFFSVIAIVAFTACDEDEVEPIGRDDHDPVTHTYQGTCVFSASFGGTEWCDTIPGCLSLVTVDDKPVAFNTLCVDSLYITPMRMMIDWLDSYSIELIADSADNSKFSNEAYVVESVPCTLRGDAGIYQATGMVSGTYNSQDIEVLYTFALGKMPLSINVDFKGTALK